jgi:hypothetical protein
VVLEHLARADALSKIEKAVGPGCPSILDTSALSEGQWAELRKVVDLFNDDYEKRHRALVRR